MIDRFTMYPVAFVTTVHPYLMVWVLSISFFVTVTVVALVSRGKTWKQLAWMSVLSYLAMTVVVLLFTTYVLDIKVVAMESFSVSPRGS